MRKGRRILCLLQSMIVTVSLSGCDSQQLPLNAQLTMLPATRTVDVVSDLATNTCWRDDYPYLDVPMVVSLTDAQASPIGGITIQIYADWSAHTTPFVDVVTLLYDFNGDGVVDPENESVSDGESGVFEWQTAQHSGSVAFTARLNLTCQYSGEIVAVAAGFQAVSTFNVAHRQDQSISNSDVSLVNTNTATPSSLAIQQSVWSVHP